MNLKLGGIPAILTRKNIEKALISGVVLCNSHVSRRMMLLKNGTPGKKHFVIVGIAQTV